MKRSEIKVGDELYYDSGQDWALPKYGDSPGGVRAVVVDLGPYRINRETWGYRAPTYQADPRGTAVLVDVYREGWPPNRKKAVPVAHLRGPYWEVLDEVSAALADRAEVRDGEKRRREMARDRAYAAETRAARLGFVAHQSNEEIRISAEEFERILDRLDGGT